MVEFNETAAKNGEGEQHGMRNLPAEAFFTSILRRGGRQRGGGEGEVVQPEGRTFCLFEKSTRHFLGFSGLTTLAKEAPGVFHHATPSRLHDGENGFVKPRKSFGRV
jgi:hypothetical protein